MPGKHPYKSLLLTAFALLVSSAAWSADDGVWSVGKSSGEVWLTTQGAQQGAQQVALGSDNVLKAGDTIRTGRNGRVLLSRGAETILIAPNSVVGLPSAAQDGMATTILQRAGSILLDVERRNVKHFEVETPYLAAVVKGTQFRVTVGAGSTKVEVSRGQVEVSDFKSGQIAQVTPGQTATSFANGRSGLQLSGAGSFAPIEQGRPRPPTIERMPVPKDGLHAPREAKGSVIRAVGQVKAAADSLATRSMDRRTSVVKQHGVRITAPLGEVTLNVNKATQGLAHAAVTDGPKGAKSKPGDDKTTATSNGGSSSTDVSGGSASDNRAGTTNASASVTTAIGTANSSISNVNKAQGKDARADGPAAPCGPACAQLLAKLPGGPAGGPHGGPGNGNGGGPQGGPGGPAGHPGGPGNGPGGGPGKP
jgi:hypothetical protein